MCREIRFPGPKFVNHYSSTSKGGVVSIPGDVDSPAIAGLNAQHFDRLHLKTKCDKNKYFYYSYVVNVEMHQYIRK